MVGFENLVYAAGYVALAVLAALVASNVVIIGARLSQHARFADRMVTLLEPIIRLFRMGNITKAARPVIRVTSPHD